MAGPFAQPPVTRPCLGERLTYAVAFGPGSLQAGARWMLRTGARLDFAGLPEDQVLQAVHEELAFLRELYADLTGCKELGVRIEVLERAMLCPRFHTDRAGLRLLRTYGGQGPGVS